jgi:hypothetical protein
MIKPSQTALRQAIEQQSSVVTKDLNMAGQNLQNAQSIMAQRLRSVVAIPLYTMPNANSDQSVVVSKGELLGALYLDSRKPAPDSGCSWSGGGQYPR